MNILLVQPPVYDFTAYDFWLRPLGLLRAAARLDATRCRLELFDFLDRPAGAGAGTGDAWGRGSFLREPAAKPAALADVPRRWWRFGRPTADFEAFLDTHANAAEPFHTALIQVTMTWWHLGAAEVIAALRRRWPRMRIVLGGPYAMLASRHAAGLGVDVVCTEHDPAAALIAVGLPVLPEEAPAPWHLYARHAEQTGREPAAALPTAALKLADGCPFRCSYCGVARMVSGYRPRRPGLALEELRQIRRLGTTDAAFYDDALLHRADEGLLAFLAAVRAEGLTQGIRLHTPNALNARLLTPRVAEAMTASGFKTFYLGFESYADAFHAATGGKLAAGEFAAAIRNLREAGAAPGSITAYILLGHPRGLAGDSGAGGENTQRVAESMHFVHELGVRIAAAEYAPVPGTPDANLFNKRLGESQAEVDNFATRSRPLIDLADPLNHNKTASALRLLGPEAVVHLKDLRRRLNAALPGAPGQA